MKHVCAAQGGELQLGSYEYFNTCSTYSGCQCHDHKNLVGAVLIKQIFVHRHNQIRIWLNSSQVRDYGLGALPVGNACLLDAPVACLLAIVNKFKTDDPQTNREA